MKKLFSLICVILLLFSLVSCRTVIVLGAKEAEEKLRSLGYSTDTDIFPGDDLLPITQVTIVKGIKGNEMVNAYYFANEEDCNAYYEQYKVTLTTEIDRCEKYRYVIVRGTEQAFEDFLYE